MKTFKEFKKWIIDEATKNDACQQGLNDANNANDYPQILEVVKKYSNWLYSAKIITTDTISEVPDEELLKANIYVKKENVEQKEGTCHYYSSTSKHYGSSTSKHYDSSTSEHYYSSTSEHYDSSTSEHYGSSTSKHYGSSTSKHYDSSTSEHYGSSTSKHYDSSTSKHYDSSTSKHYGSSTSKHYDSSTYGSVYSLKDLSIIKDSAIVRERSTGKIYFNKGKFEIVELNNN
jgi:hypothetical protein